MNKKILLVEDEQLMYEMYQLILENEGFEVKIAKDGIEGLESLQSPGYLPDLILLDIMMPRLNGLEILKKIKLDPRTKEIPVIILTNLSGEKHEQTAFANGALKYLVKSRYEPHEIIEIINQVLNDSLPKT